MEKNSLFCEKIFYCSRSSSDHKETLHGTASNYQSFILIEYPGPFPKKIAETKLKPEWLSQLNKLASERKAKLILIRNSHTHASSLKIVFVDARSRRYCEAAYNVNSLKSFNLAEFISDPATHWHTEPFIIVCTNGKKDKCCAKFGFPVFTALESKSKIPVYESSHFGGDRFAANAVLMPHGIYYGRLQPSQTQDLITKTLADEILIENYRGHSVLNFPRQSAEYFLRTHLQNFTLQFPIQFLKADISETHAAFQIRHEGIIYHVKMKKDLGSEPEFLTCTSSKKEIPTHYSLVGIGTV